MSDTRASSSLRRLSPGLPNVVLRLLGDPAVCPARRNYACRQAMEGPWSVALAPALTHLDVPLR